MKKLIVMMLLALPLFAMAQRPEKVTKGVSGDAEMTVAPLLYCEIYVVEQQNRDIIRVIFDNNTGTLIQDKELRVELDNLRKMHFESVLHAVNILSALGWSLSESFQMEKRNGVETHILFSKPVPKLLKPDISDGGKSTSTGGGGARVGPSQGGTRK